MLGLGRNLNDSMSRVVSQLAVVLIVADANGDSLVTVMYLRVLKLLNKQEY
jgi:hypothetical protein